MAMLIALQAIASLALLEVVARMFDLRGVSYYPNTAAFMDTMIIEEPIGYRNQPGLSGTFYSQPVTINSTGLRNSEFDLAPNPGKYRIVFMGDSVIFGIGVADKDTLPRQLEMLLRKEVGEINGREIEIINMGVISYNSEQELIQYQQLGAKLKADLVLLMFTDNDIEPKMWIFSKRSSPLYAIGQRSYAISLLFVLKRDLADLWMGERQPRIQSSSYQRGNPRWESIDASLTEINRIAAEDGVPFVVFTRADTGEPWKMLSAVAEREGFPLRALLPFEDDRWKDLDPKNFAAKGGGTHANAEGLAMYATLIHEEVAALGLLK